MAIVQPSTDIHAAVQVVEASPEFKQFSETNPHHYLVHAFCTAQGTPGPLELGYYSRETDQITIFKTNPIVMLPSEDVFREEQRGKLHALDLESVRLGATEALARCETERASVYPHHNSSKAILILQQHDKPFWNITLITTTLQMINMKIDAMTGEIFSRDIRSIMDLART